MKGTGFFDLSAARAQASVERLKRIGALHSPDLGAHVLDQQADGGRHVRGVAESCLGDVEGCLADRREVQIDRRDVREENDLHRAQASFDAVQLDTDRVIHATHRYVRPSAASSRWGIIGLALAITAVVGALYGGLLLLILRLRGVSL